MFDPQAIMPMVDSYTGNTAAVGACACGCSGGAGAGAGSGN